ncbi:L-seryl-tRNA(Sec) selenium transferase [Alkalihalobacillus sp. BA299]|uniref:L-seryl-tRNA(Sec) selenium transferase n=1 Tax=Alkalihalobacillus sp. BA299 TaxID=2815938 RepID=UPI001AD9863C|nr:L-seryl-tRNA(Sec) selenium transferase [Alkalihalobacillus sp. BA299]
MKKYLQELPAIHTLQSNSKFLSLQEEQKIPSSIITEWLQEEIEIIRKEILNETWKECLSKNAFIDYIYKKIQTKGSTFHQYKFKHVINATGTILHTNLGRAKLSDEAVKQVVLAAKNYSNLEYDIEKGVRGSRHDIIESTLKEITGAESAMVVNNNAAAVYLILRALANEKEVVVSRGELVEIGGSFRISSIMEESGAKLIEVGTTNKTHLFDYEQAIREETSLLMKVHTSNFKTIGFTQSVPSKDLVDLTASYDHVIVYEDLGSGALYDFSQHGIGDEPVVSKVLKMGVDIVSFSGDKLLGGPQAGIIAGKKELIDKLKRHQMARVLRVDKMTLAALEATLKSYIQGNVESIPTIGDILLPKMRIKERVANFIFELEKRNQGWICQSRDDTSQIGGGTMPEVEIPTVTAVISHPQIQTQRLFDLLRFGEPVIVTRLKEDKVIMDFRTVSEEEILLILSRLNSIINKVQDKEIIQQI